MGPSRYDTFIFFNSRYMSEEQYPDDYLPAFCCGCGYIITAQTARDAAEAMRWLPVLPLEDLFTGLSLTRLPYHVRVYGANRRFVTAFSGRNQPRTTFCRLIKSGITLAIHEVSVDEMDYFTKYCPLDH